MFRRLLLVLVVALPVLSACGDATGLTDDGYPNVAGTYLVTSDLRLQENSCGEKYGGKIGDRWLFFGDSTKIKVVQYPGGAVAIGSTEVAMNKDGTYKSSVDTDFDSGTEWIDGRLVTAQAVTRIWSEGRFANENLDHGVVASFEFDRALPSIGSNRCRFVAGFTARRISK